MKTILLQMSDRDIVVDADKIIHIDRPKDKKCIEIYVLRMDTPIVAEFETNKEVDDAFNKIVEIWTDLPMDAIKKSHIFKGSK